MTTDARVLVVQAGQAICALPLSVVRESMRPLPVLALPDLPDHVLGVARIRGQPVPVVHVGRLLGDAGGTAGRFVSVRAGAGTMALAVGAVEGVTSLPADAHASLPSILSAGRSEAVASLVCRDRDLVMVLDATRVLTDELWARLRAAADLP